VPAPNADGPAAIVETGAVALALACLIREMVAAVAHPGEPRPREDEARERPGCSS